MSGRLDTKNSQKCQVQINGVLMRIPWERFVKEKSAACNAVADPSLDPGQKEKDVVS